MSISSVGSSGNGYNMMSMQRMHGQHKPNASQMATDLFSKLDTSNKGYVEKSDLQSALDQLGSSSSSSASSSTSSADELFSKLDGDGDGKITQDEMKSGIQQLADELDSQFNQMRMQGAGQMGGAGGMPPPPGNDDGFTQDELTSQLQEIGSSDSKRSSLINSIVNNFSAADTNGDGKVNGQEAMAYEKSTQSSSTGSAESSASTQASSDTQLMKQIMDLMRAYGQQNSQGQAQNNFDQLSSLLSVTA